MHAAYTLLTLAGHLGLLIDGFSPVGAFSEHTLSGQGMKDFAEC